MIKVAEELKISGIPMENPVVRHALYDVLKLINETSEKMTGHDFPQSYNNG